MDYLGTVGNRLFTVDSKEIIFGNTHNVETTAASKQIIYLTSDRWMQQLSWSLSRWETQDIKTQPKFNQYDGRHEVDGVRKEKERLTAGQTTICLHT